METERLMTKQHQLEHIEFKIRILPPADQADIEAMRRMVAGDIYAWAGLRRRHTLAYLALAIQMEELNESSVVTE
jgi:hypothetical protein